MDCGGPQVDCGDSQVSKLLWLFPGGLWWYTGGLTLWCSPGGL